MDERGLRFALTRREGWGLLAGGTGAAVLLFLAGVGAGASMRCARASVPAPLPATADTAPALAP